MFTAVVISTVLYVAFVGAIAFTPDPSKDEENEANPQLLVARPRTI